MTTSTVAKKAQKSYLDFEELKKKVSNDLSKFVTPDDRLAIILYHFPKTQFTTDYEPLHSSLSKIAKKHPKFFEEFYFHEGRTYPYSGMLEEIFFRLQNSGLLVCENPDYKTFVIKKKARRRMEKKIIPRFSARELKEAEKISGELWDSLASFLKE